MSGRWVNVADQIPDGKPDQEDADLFAQIIVTAQPGSFEFPADVTNLARAYLARTADNARLAAALKEAKQLFKSALLCTSAEIAKDGMEFVRKWEALLAEIDAA